MENKKAVFITIIILLCIFAPLTVIGFIFKGNRNLLDENPTHATYYKGHIWFYDENDKFLSKYECQTEICEFTNPTIDDNAYGINFYANGEKTEVDVINNKYTFLTDGAVIYLYNITNGTVLQKYKSLKNYRVTLEGNVFLLQNSDGLWGAVAINKDINKIIPFEYDFIGLTNNLNSDGTLNTDKYIVLKDNKWYILNNKNSAITGYIDDPIIEYTDDYVFSANNERVRIYSYENYEYLINYQIKHYILEDDYIGIITDNLLLIYENLGQGYIKSIALNNPESRIELEKIDNTLEVKIDDIIIETIELS